MGRKVNIVSQYMSLGSAVHQVLEPLALLKSEERSDKIKSGELLNIFENVWKKYSGLLGGFETKEEEDNFKEQGIVMIKNVLENPGPIVNKTIKFYTGDFIPNIYLSEKDNIILCGLVDWVEYIEKTDSLRVLDFKTGKNDEKEDSLQLPIYKILVDSLQKRKVQDGAYWYLARDKFPKSKELLDEDMEEVKKEILEIGLEIKKLKTPPNVEANFVCKYSGCKSCLEFELVKNYKEDTDKLKYVGVGEYNQDLYFLKKENKVHINFKEENFE